MSELILVTGNPHKLEEWQGLLPPDTTLTSIDVDLPELQSDDPVEIIEDKAKRAYEIVGKPLIVEDISAGIDALNGLPGPFIKFFIKRLGTDALFQIANHQENTPATITCVATYYDGKEFVTVRGDVKGTVVATRGEAYGFSANFIPEGQTLTYAQMTPALKNTVSHRSKAVGLLMTELKNRQVL
jgi:inosine triphosphate pyrophosphatase